MARDARLVDRLGGARVLVVSPHLDDAVLSAGGTIGRLVRGGAQVDVVTLFAGTPRGGLSETARHIHSLCGYAPNGSPAGQRRAEDVAALAILGARARHAGFLDAIYRTGPDGDWLCRPGRDMFVPEPTAEPELSAALLGHLEQVAAEQRPKLVLTCAAVGGHLDHRLARDAAVRVGRTLGVTTLLWEDLPYAVGRRTGPAPGRPVPWSVDRASWLDKCMAIAQYRSQLGMLWPDGGWQRELQAHALSWDGEHRVELFWARPIGIRPPRFARAARNQEQLA